MRTPRRERPRARRRPRQEQGAVMIVVMLVLLAATASAVFAVHSTSYELRASGFQRQGLSPVSISGGGLSGCSSP